MPCWRGKTWLLKEMYNAYVFLSSWQSHSYQMYASCLIVQVRLLNCKFLCNAEYCILLVSMTSFQFCSEQCIYSGSLQVFVQSKDIMLFVSLKPCFIHLIGAFWGPLLDNPLALRHSSAEIRAITTSWDPKCYNVTLHFSCTKHGL